MHIISVGSMDGRFRMAFGGNSEWESRVYPCKVNVLGDGEVSREYLVLWCELRVPSGRCNVSIAIIIEDCWGLGCPCHSGSQNRVAGSGVRSVVSAVGRKSLYPGLVRGCNDSEDFR